MCGLFIALERGRPVDMGRAAAATAALRHRGPDGTGAQHFSLDLHGPDGPVTVAAYVGHTRLSILDPVARSDQPFRHGPHVLAYNGEIYNFRALRQDLVRRGHAFHTDGDTEVLLHLMVQGGVQALNQAHGMWAFGLLDLQAGVLTAARDRFGKKPLFYFADATRLCLASEIAPLLLYLGLRPQMVAADLDAYLRDGWAFPHADGASHLQGIRQVVAGAALHVDLASWKWDERPYFDLGRHVAHGNRAAEDLPELLRSAVTDRLVADRHVGLLLSGGVDSTLILAILASQGLSGQLTCFTGDAGKSDDADYARRCAEQLGIRTVNLPLDYGATSMDAFLQVCRHQEKPFPFIGNVLAMPQLYRHIASHDVPVVLDGTGGDELFAGYWDRYYRFAVAQALREGDDEWLAQAQQAHADNDRVRTIIDACRQQAPAGGSGTPHRAAGLTRNAEDPPDLDRFVAPAVRSVASRDPLSGFQGTLSEALVGDAQHGRLHEWLWQNDRNAMMSGIENRSPLLDHRLAPYMASGYRRKFVGGWNKHELRSIFPVALPSQWRREKQGFRWVYHRFLRHNRDAVLELIGASRILPERVDVAALLEAARRDPSYLGCSLVHRMLCIAGLEQSTAMDGISQG